MWSITFLVVLSILLGVAAWLFFLRSVKSGQYDDVEGPKYRMLDDEEKPIEGGQKRGGPPSGPSQ
jgi:cbb3-type cytochrome oxidase maturation protein